MIMKEVDVCEAHQYIYDLNSHKVVVVDKISTKFIKASTFNMAIHYIKNNGKMLL